MKFFITGSDGEVPRLVNYFFFVSKYRVRRDPWRIYRSGLEPPTNTIRDLFVFLLLFGKVHTLQNVTWVVKGLVVK